MKGPAGWLSAVATESRLKRDDLPADVDQIPIRPVWQLSDDEQRRTTEVSVRYHREDGGLRGSPGMPSRAKVAPEPSSTKANGRLNGISDLLDKTARISWYLLALMAAALGAAHAIQPGHGKTLVTAVALNPDSHIYQAVLLGMATTLAHMMSVLLIAVGLWYTGATQVGTLHAGLTQVAGFAIAAAGLWRIGRHLAGYGEHSPEEFHRIKMSNLGIVGLGMASGLVPCWDAVGLIVLAAVLRATGHRCSTGGRIQRRHGRGFGRGCMARWENEIRHERARTLGDLAARARSDLRRHARGDRPLSVPRVKPNR